MAPIRCPNALSGAQFFVQLSLRHQLHHQFRATSSHHRPASLLDLLIPAFRAHSNSTPRVRWQQYHISQGQCIASAAQRRAPSQRHFSTTASRPRTQAIYNSQEDEDGNEMMLEITSRAAKRLSEIMAKDGNPYLALRVQVESGGCHGFQYLMSLVTLPPSLPEAKDRSADPDGEETAVIREDDTIFTFSPDDGADGAAQTNLEAPKIILDAPSLELLKGSKVDFTMELIGSQFKIVDNPLATSSCGCGTSFDIKM